MEYADDIDFISYSRPYLNYIERIAPACLAEWSLQINAAKTERTSVSRQVDRAHEPWRTTRKLGSLLGDAEDVARRMQLANVSFHKMWTVWFRGAQISLLLRLRLYSAFVLPVLTYNMGTCGLTKTELNRLDAHHRRHLRQIIGIRWPHRISNDALYRRTQSSLISAAIRAVRWSVFGHVLRLPLDALSSSLSMPTWKTPAPPSLDDAPVYAADDNRARTYDALDVSCAILTTSMPCAPSTVARGGI